MAGIAREAARQLGFEGPAVEATWGARVALILAEAGDAAGARALLDRASSLVSQVRDGITATTTLSELAHVECAVARALEDGALYARAMERVLSIPEPGFRSLSLARVFDDLTATSNDSLALEVRHQLMHELEALDPFSYTLTVSEVAPILAKSAGARAEVLKLLMEASRRARGNDLLGGTNLRDVGILFARTARQLDDELLLGRAEEIAALLEEAELRVGLLGEIAIARAEMGQMETAREVLERQAALVDTIEDAWDLRSAERSMLEATTLVAQAGRDERLQAEVERGIGHVRPEDRDLTISVVCEALSRYAVQKRDEDAIRRAVRYAIASADGSTRYGEVALLAGALHECGLDPDAVVLLRDALAHGRTLGNPTDRCRALLAVATGVLQTGLVPEAPAT